MSFAGPESWAGRVMAKGDHPWYNTYLGVRRNSNVCHDAESIPPTSNSDMIQVPTKALLEYYQQFIYSSTRSEREC